MNNSAINGGVASKKIKPGYSPDYKESLEMVKRFLNIIFFFIFFNLFSFGQIPDWTWVRSDVGEGVEDGISIKIDQSGNAYVTGIFYSPSAIFGPYTLTNPNPNYADIFVLKYDSLGNILWATNAKGNNEDLATCISVDKNGNAFLTGAFWSYNLAFGGSNTLINTNADTSDIFIAKYNSSGNIQWATGASGKYTDVAYGICNDYDGNAYVTGFFGSDTLTFNNSKSVLINNGWYDMFIAKYDTYGNLLWAKNANGNNSDGGYGVCADTKGNAYVTGNFDGYSIVFGSDTLISTTGTGSSKIFIAKYDSTGNVLWAKSAAGSTVGGYSIGVDANSNSYVAGYIYGSDSLVTFDTVSLVGPCIFVIKYDSLGNVVWAKSALGGSFGEYGNHISVDANGNSYITGYFITDSITFDTITLINPNPGYYGRVIFVVKYDPNGNVLWVKSSGGIGQGTSTGTDADIYGNTYITGFYGSWAFVFGNDTLFNTSTYSDYNDFFIAKIGYYPFEGINEDLYTSEDSIIIYPNPTTNYFTLHFPSDTKQIQMVNSLGQIIKEEFIHDQTKVDFTIYKCGLYFIRVITDKQTITKRVIITGD